MDRRSFVAGMGLAFQQAQAEEQEIRVAHIGIGRRGTGLQEILLRQKNVRYSAVCDIDANARDKAISRAQRDNPKAFTDYRRVLDLKDIDALVVSTPCDLHSEMAVACLEAGKYVYCEKPMGITPEQVANVLRAAAKAKTFLQIGQQLRYMPGLREGVRQIHEEKVVGRPFVIKAQRHSGGRTAADDRDRPAWYLDPKRSGDLIVENAVHNLDICNWITGSRPESAYGHGKRYLPETLPAGSMMMDGFSVEYIYQNDMHLDYSQLYLHPRELKELTSGQWYLIFGDKGTLNLTKGIFYEMHGGTREVVPASFRDGKEDAMADFFACIREKRKPFADAQVGATAALTAIMGREAIYRRRSVTWKELGVEV